MLATPSPLELPPHASRCPRTCWALSAVIGRVNRFLGGWSRYFGFGYPSGAFHKVNWYLQIRFRRFLRTRSQRRGQLSGPSLYAALREKGLIYL